MDATTELDVCGRYGFTSDIQEVDSDVVVMVTCLNGQDPKVMRENIGILL